MAWDYPVFILAMFAGALAIAVGLMRLASGRTSEAAFRCAVCGRTAQGVTPRSWRYCPYCGAPKEAKGLQDLPTKRRSVVDL